MASVTYKYYFTESLLLSQIWRFSPEFVIFSKSSRNCPEFWDLEALEDKYTGRDCEDDSYKKKNHIPMNDVDDRDNRDGDGGEVKHNL